MKFHDKGAVGWAGSRVASCAGLITGLAVAALVMGLVWLNQGHSEILQSITNYFASLPVFMAYKLGVPKNAAIVVIFIYWGAVGALFGWLASQRRLLRHEVTALFAVALAALHWAADASLSAGIESALQAVVEALKHAGR